MMSMTNGDATPAEPSRRPWYRRLRGGVLELIGLVVVSGFGIGAALWGAFIADPHPNVHYLDAGTLDRFAVNEVDAYPEVNVYLVGLEDGRLRALDGIVKSTGCAVEWRPDDPRGVRFNSGGGSGVFTDPCGAGVWEITGDAIVGAEPMRTFQLSYVRDETGAQHVQVEVIGDRQGRQAADQ